jgi:secondary thiamine-phosphate synthase enzyme
MKTHTEYILINTKKKTDFINITSKVESIVANSKIQDGLALINPMHITAAVYINDAESGLIEDFQKWLEKLAPSGLDYKHHQTGEDNADAHLKRTLMGHQVVVPITKGRLDFGPWEQIYYAEFDGQRNKRIIVKIVGE